MEQPTKRPTITNPYYPLTNGQLQDTGVMSTKRGLLSLIPHIANTPTKQMINDEDFTALTTGEALDLCMEAMFTFPGNFIPVKIRTTGTWGLIPDWADDELARLWNAGLVENWSE